MQVSSFLNLKHGEKYYIINTSERATYDGARYFGGRVTNYHWPDHHGPPFSFLYSIAKQGYEWLKGKKQSDFWFLLQLTRITYWSSIATQAKVGQERQFALYCFLWATLKTWMTASSFTVIKDLLVERGLVSLVSFVTSTTSRPSIETRLSHLQRNVYEGYNLCKFLTCLVVDACLSSKSTRVEAWTSVSSSPTPPSGTTARKSKESYFCSLSNRSREWHFRAT